MKITAFIIYVHSHILTLDMPSFLLDTQHIKFSVKPYVIIVEMQVSYQHKENIFLYISLSCYQNLLLVYFTFTHVHSLQFSLFSTLLSSCFIITSIYS